MRSTPTLLLTVVLACGGSDRKTEDPAAAATPEKSDTGVTPRPGDEPEEPVTHAQTIQLKAADGLTVSADAYRVAPEDTSHPIIVTYHQAGWNAGEYADIAPRLVKLGFNVLAPDQRSGGERDGRDNRTVAAHGSSTSYLEALPDLEAALAWAKEKGFPRIMIWGSSYSAALVFKIAAEHPEVHAVLAFSPGEYIKGESVAAWAGKVKQPVFATSAPGKEADVTKTLLAACASDDKTHHDAKAGVHGSSTLKSSANPEGAADNWAAVEAFLKKVGG